MAVTEHPPDHNTGASIDAWHAIPSEYEDQESWKTRLGIDATQQIQLVELNHCRYQHADIPKICEFLHGKWNRDRCSLLAHNELDFGFHIVKETDKAIWWKGYGSHPYEYVVVKGSEPKYLGNTFLVANYRDLERYFSLVMRL